ncbi:MAG: hypothetical protein RLZZ293_1255, partial [Pseudomonadota bacterium]
NTLIDILTGIVNSLNNIIKTLTDNLKLYTDFSPKIDVVIKLLLVDAQDANRAYYKINRTSRIDTEFINQVNSLKTLFPSWAPNDGILTNQMNIAITSDNDLYTPGTKTNKVVQPYKLPDETIQISVDGSTIRDIYDKIGKLNADITITKLNNIVYYNAKSSNCELLLQDSTLINCNGTIRFNLTNVYGPIYSDIIYDLYTTTTIYTFNTPTMTFNSKSAIITGLSDLTNTRINLYVTNLILGDNCMENLNKCIVDIKCTNLRIYDNAFLGSIDTSIIINCVNNITAGKQVFAATKNVSLTTNKELINMQTTPIFYSAGHRNLTEIGAIIKDATNIETNDIMNVRINTVIAETDAIFQIPIMSITFRHASTLKEYDIIIQPKDWFWCYKLDNLLELEANGVTHDFKSGDNRYKYLPIVQTAREYCGLQHNFAPSMIRYKGFTFNKTSGHNGSVKVNAYFSTLQKARKDKENAVIQELSILFEILIDIAIFSVSALIPPAAPLLITGVLAAAKLAWTAYEIVNVVAIAFGSLEIISADILDELRIPFENLQDRDIELDEETLNELENATRALRFTAGLSKKAIKAGSFRTFFNPKAIAKPIRRATAPGALVSKNALTKQVQESIRILLVEVVEIDEIIERAIKLDPAVIKKTPLNVVSSNVTKVDNITSARYGSKQTMQKSVVVSKGINATKIIEVDIGDAFRTLKAEKILKVNPILNANVRFGTSAAKKQMSAFVKQIWDDLALRNPKLQYSVPSMLNLQRLLRSINRFFYKVIDFGVLVRDLTKLKIERAALNHISKYSATLNKKVAETFRERIAKVLEEDYYTKFITKDVKGGVLTIDFDWVSHNDRLRRSEKFYKALLSE